MRRPAGRTIPGAALLATGVVLLFLTFIRFGLAELGWIVFAPFLLFVHSSRTAKEYLALLAAVVAGFVLAIGKMVTSEISWVAAPMFGIPIGFAYFVALTIAGLAHTRLGARWGIYTFAAMAVVIGWVQYSFTSGASWGTLAHTQVENLPLIQLVSLTGLGGLTFLVAMGSGLAAAAWSCGVAAVRKDLAVLGVLLVSALLYGQVRLATPAPGPSLRVGGVVSPVTHTEFGPARENVDTLRPFDDVLFSRSERAADLGARVVVWNEIATVVSASGEAPLAARGQAFARTRGVALLMAYGVVDSVKPFHYVNKYRIYLPDGSMADQYVKRHPVPGDPETPGTLHARTVTLDNTRLIGAICYDYSFPGIARDNANDGGDVALVPSSDWRGIDPLHGRMALMNAVAVGLPIVRPVRAATSIISDQYGRILGSLRADSEGDHVLVAAVPVKRVPTVYARTGEVGSLAALAFCAVALGRIASSLRRKSRPEGIPQPA